MGLEKLGYASIGKSKRDEMPYHIYVMLIYIYTFQSAIRLFYLVAVLSFRMYNIKCYDSLFLFSSNFSCNLIITFQCVHSNGEHQNNVTEHAIEIAIKETYRRIQLITSTDFRASKKSKT